METVTTTVEIASPDGHDTLELTRDQTMALVEERGDNWVFANGQMMQPAQLADSDWATVGTVRIVPGLVVVSTRSTPNQPVRRARTNVNPPSCLGGWGGPKHN